VIVFIITVHSVAHKNTLQHKTVVIILSFFPGSRHNLNVVCWKGGGRGSLVELAIRRHKVTGSLA